MPIQAYNSAYGGKPGSAKEALSSMIRQYGKKRGTSIFYGLANKRKKAHGQGSLSASLRQRP